MCAPSGECGDALLIADRATVPRPNNILEWHFVIKGPADTPYAGGSYQTHQPPWVAELSPEARAVPEPAFQCQQSITPTPSVVSVESC